MRGHGRIRARSGGWTPVVLVVCALAGAGRLAAGAGAQERAAFSGGVDVVEVYATVTDASGAVVDGLTPDRFEVLEDDAPQAIEVFAAGQFPLTVALGVDRSWSMAGEPLAVAKLAAGTFLESLGQADRSLVVAIDSRAEVVAPLAMSRAGQVAAVDALDPWSTTALHDAVIATLDRIAGEPGRQALVIFSDGVDRYSTATAADVVARARRSRALIYPIAIGDTRPPLLAELAVLTGGRSFLVPDAAGLPGILGTIAAELGSQYLIGYIPSDPPGGDDRGRWRSIRVRAVDEAGRELRVRARDGYTVE